MRTTLIAASLGLFLQLAGPAVHAAEPLPPGLQPLPDVPPPLVNIDPDNEPEVTVVQKGDVREEQFRIRGRLYMIKITPANGSNSYYLVDDKGSGQFQRRDRVDVNLQIPRWVVMEF
ncbi:DUF2782 domain-containing protein [Leeia sp.]|uniref:DUF2782 domain-containing protein n=1 Tax=Leeia sp. TaxID=2884678 RepID=UPI0035B0FBE1